MKGNGSTSTIVRRAVALGALAAALAGLAPVARAADVLRLMPRAHVGDAFRALDAGDAARWSALAGMPLSAGTRTATGAIEFQVSGSPGAAAMSRALARLRADPSVLWVDARASGSGRAQARAASRAGARAWVVTPQPGLDGADLEALGERVGRAAGASATVQRVGGRLLVRLAEGGAGVEGALAAVQGVRFVDPEHGVRARAAATDPLYEKQWALSYGLSNVNAPAAWETANGTGVVVAVIDTGILAHPDLAGKVLPGYDFVSEEIAGNDGNLGRDPDPTDPGDWTNEGECGVETASSWHGTFVSGLIAAGLGNGEGIVGVSWGARILPVRALGRCGGTLVDVADAAAWAGGLAVDGVPANPYPARILNLSLGGLVGECPDFMQEVVDRLLVKGAVMVTAAGNDSADAAAAAPGACGGVINVAALSREGMLASYTNAGVRVDIAAPGGDLAPDVDDEDTLIVSTTNLGATRAGEFGYAYERGTSFAAPHVSGVLALMLSKNPALSAPNLVALLLQSARPFLPGTQCYGRDGSLACGAGMVDAQRALAATPATGSGPSPSSITRVVEFHNGPLDHYFMTASEAEQGYVDSGGAGPGWTRTGRFFFAYVLDGTQPGDAVAVWRFYGTPGLGPNSHFFTASAGEAEWLQAHDPGWTLEGLAFGVKMPQAGQCPTGTKPVRRSYNQRAAFNDSNHRLMLELADYQRMAELGWAAEGVVMCAVLD